ncbi:uncharacterized protein LOC117519689 [Thalassophryne amazonica]|uniref:uncharacterized protein LOC117519689 n=1 Tax=Thalassophryne amazonica TaxID=390379 RepID=UPI001470C9FD|nr:uncharacterized protein LOC117519689 [Thalassophryne amazonica]
METPRLLPLVVIKRGHDFTLTCSLSQKPQLFYLYKLKFGYMVQTVATAAYETISLQGQFNNSRFKFIKDNACYHLTIRNVNTEDDAAYFCHAGSAYDLDFINGTLLVVNDDTNEHNSVYVKQSPEVESVRPGETMTLQCSSLSKNKEKAGRCSDEPRVHWFKAASGESNPGLIYSYGNMRAQCGQMSCVYNLSKTMQDSSDTGMYYCAVVTCGEILFGQGTKVQTGMSLKSFFLT